MTDRSPPHPAFTHRVAGATDEAEISSLMELAIGELQKGFLSPEQIAVSRSIMGLDRTLIADGTYFLIHHADTGKLAASGGWSRRVTLYGGDHTAAQRNDALLRPGTDAARIRAMYTHPGFTRQGLGCRILSLCEDAARAEGFTRLEMGATLAGVPLYEACGYRLIEHTIGASAGGVDVPVLRMGKAL